MSHEGGASPVYAGPAPAEHPQATLAKSRGTFYGTPKPGFRPAPRTNRRRWTGRPPRLTASDIVVWLIVTALTILVLGACCALLWVVWP